MTGFRCIGLRLGRRSAMDDGDRLGLGRRPEFDRDWILMNVDSAAWHHDHDED